MLNSDPRLIICLQPSTTVCNAQRLALPYCQLKQLDYNTGMLSPISTATSTKHYTLEAAFMEHTRITLEGNMPFDPSFFCDRNL